MNQGLYPNPEGRRVGASAWVNFGYVNSAVVIRSSFNVASVKRTATGTYTIAFKRQLPNSDYAVAGSVQRTDGDMTAVGVNSMSQRSVSITLKQVGTVAADPSICCLVVFG